ncbi:2-succinyl-5-enolpyruvyl-6-hydroxy-3-cyclohexene-1-carboxylic-acid synthase [Flectobacillus sp. DC10W]|uniref:2-succinyl-5-enolpyruvyl-6-hydroxy-3-cyclohexene-1-carboxylate synthase n=1 Tax=Flectobacillus longus TaxID=2984207 RepID=A0ABT6YHT2_9BACT|nr:2-succinyl-5-enolpyruvyl-6-hydroxy-3-cyclohexene-1-carboxylic-acid synthase [Flectobacillus longus]MDI9863132.1 2-succinyl-5-enolpyruvyl-6-hydroxy-3-cyclohexene-1-carboxylic-acid synthase [Flectobacillus longus]
MAILQPIINIAEILVTKNVTDAIISPGSRNAPLTIALARHPQINALSVSDERSAAFIAMGMAQVKNKPVAICCTSGSAAYNYAPAVAEAFFQEIPLIVLTADRPTEWIHQHDGQTIYQENIYGKHVKASYQVGADYSHPDARWHIERVMNEAINTANTFPKGPVHINIPLREPFYPLAEEQVVFERPRNIRQHSSKASLSQETWEELLAQGEDYSKVMVIAGQDATNPEVNQALKGLQEEFGFVVVGDLIANTKGEFIANHDLYLGQLDDSYAPELLITFGKSVISKSLKQYIRKYKPEAHWHVQSTTHLIDTYQSLTDIVSIAPEDFFKELFESLDMRAYKMGDEEKSFEYQEQWFNLERKSSRYIHQVLSSTDTWNEFTTYYKVIENIPAGSQLHLANSMAVRYANYLHLPNIDEVEVFANRGTSGIDGCVSTAVGAALATEAQVYLLVGDVAFFYDRNALWNNFLPSNLTIILENNSGGGIFRMIDGPSQQPELEPFFETAQKMTAKLTAEESNMEYLSATNFEQLENILTTIPQKSIRARLFEIHTNSVENIAFFKKFKTNFIV